MSFDIALHEEARQTRVVVTGRVSLGQLASLMHLLEVDSATWRNEQVLLDLSGVQPLFLPPEKDLLAQVARCRLVRRNVQLRWPGDP
jgi:hypothetical protein